MDKYLSGKFDLEECLCDQIKTKIQIKNKTLTLLTLEVGQHEVVHFNVYINTYVNIQKEDQRIGGRSTLRFRG